MAAPPNRLALRSTAKVAVLLIEIAVFQQILCSPPRSNEASDGARTADRGSDVSMGISALRSPRSAHRRTLMPMLTSEAGSNEASEGARTEDRGSDVSMGIRALRSPRSAHRRTLMPMLTYEAGVERGVGRSAT